MRRTVPALATAAVAALVVVSVSAPASAAHEQIQVTGLTQNNRLVAFAAGAPGTILSTVKITGLDGELLGIDYRPATDQLHGVVRAVDGTGSFVVIDDATGQVLSRTPLRNAADGTPIVLSGTGFGVDVNPAADALRIVSDTGQNLRVLPSDRVVAGAPRVSGTTFVDGAITPADAAVTAIAYTNNDVDPTTGTVLYDLSSTGDSLAVQNPPNAGVLVTVGPLGLAVGEKAGFDVYTEGARTIALVSLVDSGRATLSVVNLTTGAVNPASTMEIGTRPAVVDIAVPTDQ